MYFLLLSGLLTALKFVMGNNSFKNDVDDGETCVVDIFRSDVTEEFPELKKLLTCDGNCFILLYSVTDSSSILAVEATYYYIQTTRLELKPPTIMAGNKIDLTEDRQVTTEEGNALAAKLDIPFIETSAKTGQNVTKLFEMLIHLTPRTGEHYKVVIFGARGVGRYSISDRYVNDWFLTGYLQISGADFRKRVIVKDIPGVIKKEERKGIKQKIQRKLRTRLN